MIKKENRSELQNLLSTLKYPPTPERRPFSSRREGAELFWASFHHGLILFAIVQQAPEFA
jgi:hypothetical protein